MSVEHPGPAPSQLKPDQPTSLADTMRALAGLRQAAGLLAQQPEAIDALADTADRSTAEHRVGHDRRRLRSRGTYFALLRKGRIGQVEAGASW
jgi:hypothetical protein